MSKFPQYKNHPTQERLNELFAYLPNGTLVRTKKANSKGGRGRVGDIVGTLRSNSPYLGANVDYKFMVVHQLVWIMHYGAIPDGYVLDHISRDSLDNRIDNLRLVTMSGNSLNRSKFGGGTSDYKGVSLAASRKTGQWRAQFRRKHLGCFNTEEEARDAYDEAAAAYGAPTNEELH